MADIQKEGMQHLKKIEKELSEIRDRTANPRRAFVTGILYGAGALIGGIFALAAIGWVLSFLGIVPGLGDLAAYLQSLVDKLPQR